ncbi:MAG: SDR family NAD(P)-dependent oxidoreductase [Defluviimonas sp.]|nr:SDR family NAD(P)-dependent oxidoreductase [Defluviimonas sp.]
MTILITGANRGLGLALLDGYRGEGRAAIGTARRAQAGLEPLDVNDPASVRSLAAGLAGQPIDTLICNAGVYADKGQRLEDGYPAEVWAESFAVNATGVFLTVQALLANLRAAAGGSDGAGLARIAIISSQMASDTLATGGSYAYRASKAAALNLGRNLATDLKPERIAVGIYHPGWVQTDMGGASADITPAEAAVGLRARIAALDLATTGCFETWDGQPHPF